MRSLLVGVLLALTVAASAASVSVLDETYDAPPRGKLEGGASLVPGQTGQAVKLEGTASVLYDGLDLPREQGRIELDLCPHAPITPRTDGKHWMLLSDVGAGSAWPGATVIYWDRETAQLGYGYFEGGWKWLIAKDVEWSVGTWRHLAFTYGPAGRTLEIDGQVVARDAHARGIDPRALRLGYFDAYSVAAPVLVDNLRISGELADAIRCDWRVVCPAKDDLLDTVTLTWSVGEPGTATLALVDDAGRVVAPILGPKAVEPGVYRTPFDGGQARTGEYQVRLSIARGDAVTQQTTPLAVERELRWKPAANRMDRRFPLGVWYFWEDDASYINRRIDDQEKVRAYFERTMADLKRLGVNTIVANWTPRDHRQLLLDTATRHGLRVIVHLDEVNAFLWDHSRFARENYVAAFREAVGTVKRHPATLGYYLVDEPTPTPENAQKIEIAKKIIEALDPERPGFSCLLGNYDDLFRQVGYHVLLVDIYPVYTQRLQGDVLHGYISAVDHAREVAAGKPVWVIPQCFGFGKPQPRAIPTPNEVSLMVWEAIAHGAKGIVYFIYQSTTGIQGEWLQGIVNMDLEPLDHRHAEVQRVNAAVRKLAPTLLKLHWEKNDVATASTPNVDVQAFRHANGRRYLCVVNQDTHAAVTANLEFTLSAAPKVRQVRDVATGARVGDSSGASIRLEPGEGKLLEVGER